MNEAKREATPFERFTDFTRRIIAVPKAEIKKQDKKYRRRRKSSKRA